MGCPCLGYQPFPDTSPGVPTPRGGEAAPAPMAVAGWAGGLAPCSFVCVWLGGGRPCT